MSVQDNKFPIILGAGTAVAVGVLAWWGMSSKGKYGEALDRYNEVTGEIRKLTGASIFPNQENLQEKERNVSNYQTEVGDMLKDFDSYRVPKVENVPAGEFTDGLRKAREEVVAALQKVNPEIKIPSEFYVGQNKFTTEPPSQNITGLLNYELGAVKQLLLLLAAAGPTELNNVHRVELPEEKGQQADLEGSTYRMHPVELSFTGRESVLRDFVASLDSQKDYYYLIRSVRVKNERKTAPQAKDARFEQPKAATPAVDPFAGSGFVIPGEETAPAEEPAAEAPAAEESAAPADSGEILKQVIGAEKVQVFLRIDILQFLDAKALPER